MEVEVEAVPRHEEPREMDLESDVGVELLVCAVAKGAMHFCLDLEASGIVVEERLHELVRTVELGDVFLVGFVGSSPHLGVCDGVVIPGEVATRDVVPR